MRSHRWICLLLSLISPAVYGQSPAGAAAIGAGAAAVVGGNNAGSTSPSGGGPSGSAPIEVNIMIYHGLTVIAKKITKKTKAEYCDKNGLNPCAVLLEDPTSANQIALYEGVEAYYGELDQLHKKLADAFKEVEKKPAPPNVERKEIAPNQLPTPSAPTVPAGAASQTPQWITNSGAVTTTAGGLRSGMTYTSSPAQPTTQSFEVLLEKELNEAGIKAYTSTSALVLSDALETAFSATDKDDLIKQFSELVNWTNDINNWITQCKGIDPSEKKNKDSEAVRLKTVCDAQIGLLTTAQQLSTGYASLIQNSNDGSGNMVIVDVLKGFVLSRLMKQKIPSLQVSVAAAAGSTRVNSWFLVNLVYVPKPSYNAGVIATWELRGPENLFVDGGAEAAFYDYNKNWTGDTFKSQNIRDSCHQDAFCSVPELDNEKSQR